MEEVKGENDNLKNTLEEFQSKNHIMENYIKESQESLNKNISQGLNPKITKNDEDEDFEFEEMRLS